MSWLVRCALLLLVVEPTFCQDLPEHQSRTPVVASQVRISATQLENPPEIPANFRIPFSVINGSLKPLVLREFRARFLIPSGAFLESRNDIPNTKVDTSLASAHCPHPQRSIPPGAEEIILCEFESTVTLAQPWDLGKLALNWSTLTFKPGKYQIHAVARLRQINGDGENEAEYIASSIIEVDLHPSIWQVVLGVLLGSLMLAAFRVISGRHPIRMTRRSTIPKTLRAHWILKLLHGLGLTISGWIAGSMLVFMTFRMADVGFPIAISISDFYGGIVVGLFSYLGALWLLDKLIPTSTDDTASPESPADNPIEPPAVVAQAVTPPDTKGMGEAG